MTYMDVGYTNSTDFPLTGAFQPASGGGQDVFVTKLSPAGNGVVYSTYLGGSGNDYAYSVQVDAQGEAYFTGSTTSANFPVTAGAFQTTIVDTGAQAPYTHGFVTKLNAAGNGLVYSTYLAGTGTGNAADVPAGIAIDAIGNAYVGGYTGSADFPTTPGVLQPDYIGGLRHIFVTKLNTTGAALIYSTFVGGPNADYANSIAVDASGHAYVTGYTNSCAFTLQNPIQGTCGGKSQNMIVAKLNPTGTALEYATFVGFGTATGRNIAVSPTGEAYVTGFTQNDGPFPITPGALQPTFGGGTKDAYVLKLNSTGTAFDYATIRVNGSR